MEVLQADGAVKYVMYFDNDGGSDVIVVVTENMVIGQFSVDPSDGSLVEVTKIKVSQYSSISGFTYFLPLGYPQTMLPPAILFLFSPGPGPPL